MPIAPFLLLDTATDKGLLLWSTGPHHLQELFFSTQGGGEQPWLPVLEDAVSQFSAPPAYIAIGIGPGSYTGIRTGAALCQALAYGWKAPIVTFPSLCGFVPPTMTHFAVLVDARIGGFYWMEGVRSASGTHHTERPQLVPFEEVRQKLQDIPTILSPHIEQIRTRLNITTEWETHETSPAPDHLTQLTQTKYRLGQTTFPPTPTPLMYLKETEAERRWPHG